MRSGSLLRENMCAICQFTMEEYVYFLTITKDVCWWFRVVEGMVKDYHFEVYCFLTNNVHLKLNHRLLFLNTCLACYMELYNLRIMKKF